MCIIKGENVIFVWRQIRKYVQLRVYKYKLGRGTSYKRKKKTNGK